MLISALFIGSLEAFMPVFFIVSPDVLIVGVCIASVDVLIPVLFIVSLEVFIPVVFVMSLDVLIAGVCIASVDVLIPALSIVSLEVFILGLFHGSSLPTFSVELRSVSRAPE